MTSGNAKSEESEFEPDNHFFDNFLDGMDVLIDKCRDSEDERWIADGTYEESDTSSGGDRMVIDLRSSPESEHSEQVKSNEGNDIKDILTNRVLAHLEKSSSHGENKRDSSFPTNQLVVDVLDRLKKTVQQKNESPSSSIVSHPGTSKNYRMERRMSSRERDKALKYNAHEEILSNESDEEKKRDKNMTKLLKWIFGKEKRSRFEQPQASLSRAYSRWSDLDEHKRKRKRHKKHKSLKSNEKRSRHRRHKKSKKKVRKESVEQAKAVNSDPSLESVSSEDENDILNKDAGEGSENEGVKYSVEQEKVKQTDCEEGEVLSSSSSDWESARVKRRRGNVSPLRLEYFSPSLSDGPRLRRNENQRISSPSWLRQRLRPEDRRGYVVRRIKSPVRYERVYPWEEHGRILRPSSLSPVPIHLHSRSPNGERIPGERSSPFMDDFGYPIDIMPLPHRRIEHIPSIHRALSPPKEVHESRPLPKSYAPMEIHPRDSIPCHDLRRERRFPPESDNERREKPSLLLRCLTEIRRRSYKPGRFSYDSNLKESVPRTDRPLNSYSSPFYSGESQARLKFTTPTTRHVGTSTTFQAPTTSVGCQTGEHKPNNPSEDQVWKSHSLQTQSPAGIKKRTRPTVKNHDSSDTSSKPLEVITRVPVEEAVERKDTAKEIVTHNPESGFRSSQRKLEMWKSIVSFRYPDLNEKEKEHVVLMKSMETEKQ